MFSIPMCSNKTFAAGMATALLLASCATTTAPWISNLESVYPEARYLAAVGSGDTRRAAEADAVSALAQRVSVDVKVDTVAQKRYSDLVNEETYNQSVGLQASQQFQNLRYSDPVTDAQGRTQIVAFLERGPTASLLKASIQADLKKIESLRTQSADSSLLRTYAIADAAYLVGQHATATASQLKVVQGSSVAAIETQIGLESLARDRDAAATQLTYRVVLKGDTDGKIGAMIKAGLATLGLSAADTGRLQVTGSWSVVPVDVNPKYKSVEWTINVSLVDEVGAALVTVYKVSRENGLDEAASRVLALREVEKVLSRELAPKLQDRLSKLVSKP